jgi:hypothetical protein
MEVCANPASVGFSLYDTDTGLSFSYSISSPATGSIPSDQRIVCTPCTIDFGSAADEASRGKYLYHIQKRHKNDVSLGPLQIPALDILLLRCQRC